MPVQRKVFRIEESVRRRAPEHAAAPNADHAQHRAFMAERALLRTMLEPRSDLDRTAQQRAEAQIAQAQAFKRELSLLHAAVAESRGEIAALGANSLDCERTARASRELAAIVGGTERATQSILQAAEEIDHAAGTLSAALTSGHDKGLAHDIQDRVVQIFEACNFQDLTGQRVALVLETLKSVEVRAARLLEIWQRIEAAPAADGALPEGDQRFLNGPKLADDRGHSSQGDIDRMFGRA